MPIKMDKVVAIRERIGTKSGKVSFDAFIVDAAGSVMRNHPRFRSRLVSEEVLETDDANVGVALGLGSELFIPVVRGADRLTPSEIEKAIVTFRDKAETKSFVPHDFAGATLTVSNLGMYPVQDFIAVIPPDQTAIVTVGCVDETDNVAVFTLSVDHRLINGREAAVFLTTLKERLEGIAE
jgi:pyruvate dehydrogenase E2 component (dihydrolipoamide acetyltransferase)